MATETMKTMTAVELAKYLTLVLQQYGVFRKKKHESTASKLVGPRKATLLRDRIAKWRNGTSMAAPFEPPSSVRPIYVSPILKKQTRAVL